MEHGRHLKEMPLGPTVTDETLLVLFNVIKYQPERTELPMSIGALGRSITRTIREFVDRDDPMPIFEAVDLPVVEAASSMAIQKALGNLRTIDVLSGGKSSTLINTIRLEQYAEESRMYFTPEQQAELEIFSLRLNEELVSV
jgi:hypothetical protein